MTDCRRYAVVCPGATSPCFANCDLRPGISNLTLRANPDDDGKEITESHRQVCRISRAHATADAGNEPGKTRRKAGAHVPAGAKIREGNKPYRREPPSAHFANPESAGGVFLRRGIGPRKAERGRIFKSAGDRLCLRLPVELGWPGVDEGLFQHQGLQAAKSSIWSRKLPAISASRGSVLAAVASF